MAMQMSLSQDCVKEIHFQLTQTENDDLSTSVLGDIIRRTIRAYKENVESDGGDNRGNPGGSSSSSGPANKRSRSAPPKTASGSSLDSEMVFIDDLVNMKDLQYTVNLDNLLSVVDPLGEDSCAAHIEPLPFADSPFLNDRGVPFREAGGQTEDFRTFSEQMVQQFKCEPPFAQRRGPYADMCRRGESRASRPASYRPAFVCMSVHERVREREKVDKYLNAP